MQYQIQTPNHLALALKSRRKEMGKTQAEAAASVGLLAKTVSALESRPEKSSIASLLKLLTALDLEIAAVPKQGSNRKKTSW